MKKHIKEYWKYAQPLGFAEPVMQGDGHYRMTHENGGYVTLSGSMYDGKEKLRIIGDIHRVAEQPKQGPNSGRHSFKKEHSRLHLGLSESEERAIDKAARLNREWDDAIAALQKINDYYDVHGRNDADDALGWVVWQKLDDIEGDLADINRIPGSEIPWPRPRSHDEYVELWLERWPKPAPTPQPEAQHAAVSELIWEAPPAPATDAGKSTSKWARVVAELKARPGEWAVVNQDCTASIATYLKKKFPELEVRARGVKKNRAERIYARWVGETKE